MTHVNSCSTKKTSKLRWDIRAVVRAELKSLRSSLKSARGGDAMSRIHIADAVERVNAILDPK